MKFHRSIGILAGLAAAATMVVATASPAFAASSGSLTVYADTVTNQGCVQTNVFHRGIDILVWRINVLQNGQQDKNATVTVQVKGGQTFKAPYNTHDHFFTAAWNVPFNQPTGTIQYTVTATDGSETASYQPQFMVAPSELMIVPATYAVAPQVGSAKTAVTSFAKNVKSIPVYAKITYPTDSGFAYLTSAKVTASIGLEGNVNAKGVQIVSKTVSMRYNASLKTWVASIPTAGLKAGLYVVVVNAADHVTPANTGTGTTLGFSVQ